MTLYRLPSHLTNGAKCDCLHGTCGSHCHRCCSGGPWAPHQPCEEDRAECSCGERGACSYDDTGTILCVNCTENRAGPLCDKCLFGYYNSLPDGPCVPCDCDPQGSDGSCTWNKKHHQVSCTCLPGFTGHLCDTCEDPGAVYPHCQVTTTPACKCDPRGIVDSSRVCDDVCECKANVVGERCDACAPGHYGLSEELAVGCRPCYCSHITDSCSLATAEELEPPRDVILPLGEAWLIADIQGNNTLEPSVDEQGKPFVIGYEVEGWENFYWVSNSLTGEQLAAYGGEVRASLYWGIVRGDTEGNPTFGPDVILIGSDGTKLAYSNISHESPGQLQISAPLVEGNWVIMGEDMEVASRIQLMDVLRDLRGVMLKAHYHLNQDEVRLEGVEVHGSSALVREVCACAGGHTGAHCQRCAWHHARVARAHAATPRFECVPCACNGHARCDTVDGPCGPCLHNTTGPHCERCLPGHYGNPVQGACKPCACPLYESSNNFSPNCALASSEGDEFVCTQCPDGYTGDHCESCDFGYWGSPTTLGSSCQPCACGGSPCHPTTGLCLTCPPHTEGARCDLCKEGYWFGAGGWSGAGSACVACACGAGALSAACDARSGQCACRPGWGGRACDTCVNGHGGISDGCPSCRCGTAAINDTCDPVTGECMCAPGAAPPSCDVCLDEHYGLNATGCLGCNCSSIGAESNVCDIRTGQCRCRQHVTGRACDTCEEGYWGLQLGGCRRCSCGSGASACDPVSGACACAEGVGGAQCDTCLSGYYGFGPAGCLPCPVCTDGKVCSPHSGRCVCPGGSMGAGCRQCAKGYWAVGNTCRPCNCGAGAVSNTCDPHTGQCRCKAGWEGDTCEQCSRGHYGAKCRPCQCHEPGTRGCEDGVCDCDEWGRCPCKENVVGEKCDACLQGTFGLSGDNPSGCTACFCFGRAAQCSQATLSRAALHAAAPLHVTLQRASHHAITTMDQDSLLAIHTHTPDATISLPWPPVPVYVELDKRFVGDRVTSYGGSLRFRVEEEGGVELSREVLVKFPLVRLYTKSIVLEYFERAPVINGTHSVRFHESLWMVRGRGIASRSALMLALRRLDKILIRVTTRAPTHQDHVHALLLNVSLDTAIPGLSRSAPALGVELCDCPRGYSASSCQEPALGYWMPPPKVHLTSVAGTIVINLEGDVQPCLCNGRASRCDPDTGDCLNCTAGTGGPRCAVCAPGYYGTPDSPGGCQACPCPSRARNFASACTIRDGQLQCLCKPGYSGPECETCAVGYRRVPTGACVSCACDRRGALSPHCDVHGRCRCRDFAAGPRCDLCAARRTFMDVDGCRPCDNCTQTLLDSVEQLTSDLRTRADPTELSRIPKPFAAVREYQRNTTILRNDLHQYKNNLIRAQNLEQMLDNLESSEHKTFTEANALKTEASRREKEAEYLSLESMSALEEVLKVRRKLSEQVEALDEFARGEKHLSAHRALKEAKHLLRQIKDTKLIDYVTGANDVFDSAHLQSTAIQEYNYRLTDLSSRLNALRSALNTWEQKAADLHTLAQTVWTADDTVTALEENVKPRLASVRDIGLRCRLVLEDISTLSPKNVTDEVRSLLLQSQSYAIKFPSLSSELSTLTLAAEEKEGILYNLTPAYKQKYLDAVEEHVQQLGEKAKEYKNLFAGSRAAASMGVTAAQAWSRVATHVKEASDAADTAARAASAAASLVQGNVPMAETAARGKSTSEDLERRGAAVLAKAEELRNQLEHLRRGADIVSVILRGLGWQERELSGRPKANVQEVLSAANEQADRVFASTRVLYDEASELRRRVRYHLRRQLTELQRHGDTALGAAQEHVSQIRGNTVRGAETADALAAAAAARARQHAAAASTLNPALAALRDKVAKARHAAESISVSLTSVPGAPVGCARAYAVWPASAAVTRLALALSFDDSVRDGPLMYLLDDSQETDSYMKLFVSNSRLHLVWDLGGGEASIVHPEVLQPTHDDADHTSYKIEIERIWNTVHLRVERAGSSISSASNSSSPSAVTLRSSRVWLGAPPAPHVSPGGARPGTLPACVHALYADDNTVGLWNFVHQPKEAQCTGCTQRWYSSRGGESSLVWFNGGGYVELQRSRARPADRRQFSVAFTFRTRDEDALLFMALDTANNRSVSVYLRECRVVFRVEYGGSRLHIAAAGRHCAGRPAHVQAIRVFASNKLEKGSLRVNGEETLGSPTPPVQSAAALPDLSSAPYWVAGVPPGHAGVVAERDMPAPLLGCVGAVTVDRSGYDLMDAPARHGVEPRCGERTLRSAIVKGAGYIELPSPLLRRKASLGLSFRARAPDGVLLYRAPSSEDNELDDDEDKHYLALVMIDGELQVAASAGKEELRLRTNGTRFDDGRLHTVRIVRMHKQLELWADEERLASGALAGNAFPSRAGGLFLAGVRDAPPATVPLKPFVGTVADLIVDSQLIGLETAVAWAGARLGRADDEPASITRTEPHSLQQQPSNSAGCTKTSSYTVEAGAVKFGDVAHSHATLKLPKRTKELALTLQFRTYANDGLLVFVPGSKNKAKHYVALMIKEGKLRLVVRGRKRKEISLTPPVADGTWRSVSVRVSRARVSLSSGGAATQARAPAAARAHRLYVGGVPAPPALPNLPNAIVRLGGFLGCVRRVVLNGRAEDLVRDTQAHHGVGQCFPNVEQAAYFGGDAHATWSSTWSLVADQTESSTELKLQFRTSEPNGVLLAAAGLLLQVQDGAVVLSRQTAGGERSRISTRGGGGAACDGGWHAVRARLSARGLALRLDAGELLKDAPPARLLDDSADLPPPATLYIGGVPEGVLESTEGGKNFNGCIRDVSVGGQKRGWTDMESIHNVLLDSCPIPE
ncbi:wing blister isoform X2 [Anticarsia gemmatalis]|uniref:wing blister isoform X2 n=1 Tax=Anticarsia gemmatalis TaxID=129554 RepID=UPI003F77242A